MKLEQIKQDYNRLHMALDGQSSRHIAYPILARHGMMERTENGYKAIDPEAVDRRCRELIDRIMDDYLQSLSE